MAACGHPGDRGLPAANHRGRGQPDSRPTGRGHPMNSCGGNCYGWSVPEGDLERLNIERHARFLEVFGLDRPGRFPAKRGFREPAVVRVTPFYILSLSGRGLVSRLYPPKVWKSIANHRALTPHSLAPSPELRGAIIWDLPGGRCGRSVDPVASRADAATSAVNINWSRTKPFQRRFCAVIPVRFSVVAAETRMIWLKRTTERLPRSRFQQAFMGQTSCCSPVARRDAGGQSIAVGLRFWHTSRPRSTAAKRRGADAAPGRHGRPFRAQPEFRHCRSWRRSAGRRGCRWTCI